MAFKLLWHVQNYDFIGPLGHWNLNYSKMIPLELFNYEFENAMENGSLCSVKIFFFFQLMYPFCASLIILAIRTLLVTALFLSMGLMIYILTITRKTLMIISTILMHMLIHFAIASMVILDIHALKVSNICLISEYYGPLTRCVKLGGCACAGNAGNVSPPPRVSDPDMHHGTYITHVPWCMPGSLTGGFHWRDEEGAGVVKPKPITMRW